MKKSFFIALILVLGVHIVASAEETAKTGKLSSDKDKLSYSLGWDLGTNLKKQSIDISPDILSAAIKDALKGAPSQMTEDEMKTAIQKLQQQMIAKQQEAQKSAAEKNKKDGETFLAKNKTAKGVKTLPSGLQYKVITLGKGEKPKATDTVKCHYRGTLIDGTEFDSSYKRGQPVTFPLNGVIKGWTEALQLMPVGSKYELYIPSELAYGPQGAGGVIGPNSTLIFTVELISIEK